MTKLIEDLSILTNVQEATLRKFLPTSIYCIGHAVHEGQKTGEEVTCIDIGFGELHIKVQGDLIKYKFIPSTELENTVSKTVLTNTSPIALKLDNSLQTKIDKAYKDIMI